MESAVEAVEVAVKSAVEAAVEATMEARTHVTQHTHDWHGACADTPGTAHVSCIGLTLLPRLGRMM